MMRGAKPAVAMPTTRAFGVKPCLMAASSEANNKAHAPSFTPDALPAVTVSSGPFTPLSLESIANVGSQELSFGLQCGYVHIRGSNVSLQASDAGIGRSDV
jgi:hypothetical protein